MVSPYRLLIIPVWVFLLCWALLGARLLAKNSVEWSFVCQTAHVPCDMTLQNVTCWFDVLPVALDDFSICIPAFFTSAMSFRLSSLQKRVNSGFNSGFINSRLFIFSLWWVWQRRATLSMTVVRVSLVLMKTISFPLKAQKAEKPGNRTSCTFWNAKSTVQLRRGSKSHTFSFTLETLRNLILACIFRRSL